MLLEARAHLLAPSLRALVHGALLHARGSAEGLGRVAEDGQVELDVPWARWGPRGEGRGGRGGVVGHGRGCAECESLAMNIVFQ